MPDVDKGPVDIDLFAGAGGLTLGLIRGGFEPSLLVEKDTESCRTLEANHRDVSGGPITGEIRVEDVRRIRWSDVCSPVRLLAAGAPCQPFSLGGNHKGEQDDRNLFPEVIRAIDELRPEAALLENVRGLARQSFRPYFDYMRRQMRTPSLGRKTSEDWREHDRRLQQHESSSSFEPEYHVRSDILNAADYGVPQVRHRVFICVTNARSLDPFIFPRPTHSRDALLHQQACGAYWQRHQISARCMFPRPQGYSREAAEEGLTAPWATVRDALSLLPSPATSENDAELNHWLIPGARLYSGHTGSPLDWPSKTIKAGVHGVPGGENVVVFDDGSFRYFTLRETASLQAFPESFIFIGARSSVTKQIGNAVPVDLAQVLAKRLRTQLRASSTQ